jgi:hypothetical protein
VSLRAGAWLAARELRARWPRVLLAAGVVAVLAGAAVTMELLARAREEAIADRIDAMGPPLTVVPAGTTSEALSRYDLGGAVLPPGAYAHVRAAAGGALRRAEGRLVLEAEVGDRRLPLVGLPPEAWPEDLPDANAGVLAGAELGRTMPEGTSFALGGEEVSIARVLPPAGSIDDAALFVPLAAAQRLAPTDGLNEVRVYLRAGEDPAAIEARLRVGVAGAVVVRHDRGEVAGGEAQSSLAAHRKAAYAVLALVALLCLLIAAHLDASERRLELATLVAIGAPASGILAAIVLRTAITGAAGALLGTAAGIVAAAAQDPAASSAWSRWLFVGGSAVVAAVLAGAAASLAVGIVSVLRDPVRDLQEG